MWCAVKCQQCFSNLSCRIPGLCTLSWPKCRLADVAAFEISQAAAAGRRADGQRQPCRLAEAHNHGILSHTRSRSSATMCDMLEHLRQLDYDSFVAAHDLQCRRLAGPVPCGPLSLVWFFSVVPQLSFGCEVVHSFGCPCCK